jgi:hypothetical protein
MGADLCHYLFGSYQRVDLVAQKNRRVQQPPDTQRDIVFTIAAQKFSVILERIEKLRVTIDLFFIYSRPNLSLFWNF